MAGNCFWTGKAFLFRTDKARHLTHPLPSPDRVGRA